MSLDKSLLFKPRLEEAEVEIPGVGTVRVRALTQDEATQIQQAGGDLAKIRRQLALGLVDPEMSEAEVGRWMKAAPAGELDRVGRRIAELSGMFEGARKSGVPGDGRGPDDGVRDVPSDQAGDDGGPAAGGDAGG